jgi:hypothetical protein
MTRHDMVQPSAAGAPPSATDPRASIVIVAADRFTTSNVQSRLNLAEAQRSGMSASASAHPSVGHDIADISRSSKSP